MTSGSCAHSESRRLFQVSRTTTIRLDIPASATGHRCVSFNGRHIANTSPWDSVNESSVPVLLGGRSLQDTWEAKLTYVSAVLREPGGLNEPGPTGLQDTWGAEMAESHTSQNVGYRENWCSGDLCSSIVSSHLLHVPYLSCYKSETSWNRAHFSPVHVCTGRESQYCPPRRLASNCVHAHGISGTYVPLVIFHSKKILPCRTRTHNLNIRHCEVTPLRKPHISTV